jgi:predicted dehydrogenase
MRAGKSVICEKPVSLNCAELEEMIAVSNECGVLFTVHQNRRFDEDFHIMKKIFDENTLGKVYNIESRVHGSRGIPSDWRNKKECGGGMIFDWGIHLFDQMFMMMGDRKVKSVFCDLYYVTNEECDDGFKVLVEFEDDIKFHVEVGTSNFIPLPRWYMLGENGSAVLEDWGYKGKIVMVSDWENRDAVPVEASAGWTKTMAPRTDDTISEYPLPDVEVTLTDYYRNIAQVLNGTATPLVTHEQMLRDMRFMEACFRSYEEKRIITDFE